MKPVTLLLLASLTALATLAQATPLEIKLPPETAVLKPDALPGYQRAQQKCATCHSADYINYQPPGMTLAQWTGEVGKMQHAYGAPITDEDVAVIGAYLAVAYGSAKATDAQVIAASAVAAPTPQAADAMSLLKNNACLACHSVDKQVVGPAYREVAARYGKDPQALAKLAVSIQKGGSGKWGVVAMPPFAQLSDADIQTMAAFILSQ